MKLYQFSQPFVTHCLRLRQLGYSHCKLIKWRAETAMRYIQRDALTETLRKGNKKTQGCSNWNNIFLSLHSGMNILLFLFYSTKNIIFYFYRSHFNSKNKTPDYSLGFIIWAPIPVYRCQKHPGYAADLVQLVTKGNYAIMSCD